LVEEAVALGLSYHTNNSKCKVEMEVAGIVAMTEVVAIAEDLEETDDGNAAAMTEEVEGMTVMIVVHLVEEEVVMDDDKDIYSLSSHRSVFLKL
jgi:hypothetical protein